MNELTGSSMGYYSSLIQRKFRDLVGSKYESIRREYSDFLATEEEMKVPPVNSILLPVDNFVQTIPDSLIEVLIAYGARINLVYIIDSKVLSLIDEMVGEEMRSRYHERKEKHGRDVLKQFSEKLEESGLEVHHQLFSGSKIEDVVRLTRDHDLVALFRGYGSQISEIQPLSPDVSQINRRVKRSVIIY